MTTSLRNRLSLLCLCLLAASVVYGQNVAPELNITLGEQRVRFAPTRGFQEMRLEVINSLGEVVFTHTTTEAEFDWNLRAANSEALAPGLYRYALTLKFGEDQSRQHAGHFIVEKGQDQIWLTASDGTEVSGTALNAARSGGRSVAGFRTADDKSAKREVEGREIVDEKGNKLADAKKATKQEKAALAGTVNKVAKFDATGLAANVIDSAIVETGGNVGIGTAFPNTKLSVSANNGTPPSEVGIVGYFANANNNNTFITADAYGGDNLLNLHSDFLFRRARGTMAAPSAVQANDIVGQIQMRGYGATGFATTSRAGIRLVAAENWTNTAQGAYLAFMTNPIGQANINVERMRLTDTGNLGIGVTAPVAKLEVGGDIRSSALRQELTVEGPPNVINGFMGTGGGGATPGNRVTAGVVGATIGGGGFNGFLTFPTMDISPSDVSNRVTDWFGTVGGGFRNRAGSDAGTLDDAAFATVGGGKSNIASGDSATVGGGVNNIAGGYNATVGGGLSNFATGRYATVPGGLSNTASGGSSLAAGYRANANHDGTFVWGDSTPSDFASTANDQFLIRATGGVGIGTNAPLERLHVGGGNILLDNNQGLFMRNTGGTSKRILLADTNNVLHMGSGGGGGFDQIDFDLASPGNVMSLANTGRVGIGTTTPTQKLHVVGNILATGTITPSDLRYKQHVAAIPQALARITQMRGVSYQWKQTEYPQMGFTDRVQLGFIAQELKEVLPEAVYQDAQGMYSVNYTSVIPLLVEAVKEQQATLEHKDAEIKALNARMAALEQMLQQLTKAPSKQAAPKQQ